MRATARFNAKDLVAICDILAERDPHLSQILEVYG